MTKRIGEKDEIRKEGGKERNPERHSERTKERENAVKILISKKQY